MKINKNTFFIILLLLFILVNISCSKKKNNGSKDLDTNNSYKNTGIILATKVKVRQSPSLKSKVITVVKEGENVQILETGKQKTTIGKYSDKWIKIKTKSGKTGFSFGAFIFDLNSLINKKWYLRTSSGEIFGFILKENFDFYIIKGDAEVEKDPVISKYGSFKIEGRKISFSKKFGGHSRKKINSLFLYRYKSKNVLLEKEYHIDDRSFLPPSGIPWGWWKGR